MAIFLSIIAFCNFKALIFLFLSWKYLIHLITSFPTKKNKQIKIINPKINQITFNLKFSIKTVPKNIMKNPRLISLSPYCIIFSSSKFPENCNFKNKTRIAKEITKIVPKNNRVL